MKTVETQTLYTKSGRKYVPVHAFWHGEDEMKVGTFRLTYAYTDGGRRYEYDVTPATAPTAAAMLIAKDAMVNAITEACRMRPQRQREWTKREAETIERFRAEMGGMFPSWWTENAAYEMVDAAIKAVLEYRP